MKWLGRIMKVKLFLVLAAIVIAVGSLSFSHLLAYDLKIQERNKMEVWAEAMMTLNMADENTDLNLVLKVLNENDYIPVIVFNSDGKVTDFRNLSLDAANLTDSLRKVSLIGRHLLEEGKNIRINLGEDGSDYIDVCYDESVMLKRLSVYPFVQLGVFFIFLLVGIFAFLTSKKAEQNKLWVGLSKETAHQLGTPTSSLMAWMEILRESYPDNELIPEMDKDVKRLQLIAERFSKIGSFPELVSVNLNTVLRHVVDYMNRRTSKRIRIVAELSKPDILVQLNASLFEWVLENLVKNAVDAIGDREGSVTMRVERGDTRIFVYVSDTGKGIRKKDIGNVFRPGFTTKRRGWGLGLSLARRIIEEYHSGRIYVKSSVMGVGTTFCIELKV